MGEAPTLPTPTPGMSQKKRLLAKAQSDWILTEPKTEPTTEPAAGYEREKAARYPSTSGTSARYGSYEYLDRNGGDRQREREVERYERERVERERIEKERDRLEREQQERIRVEMERIERREREDRMAREQRDQMERERLERERAEYDYQAAAMSARERDLRDQLAGVVPRPELAPPLAHQPEYGAVHRSAQHFAHSSPAHESLYAPATVYVTAAGYQQIAIPPPAHHARPVLPPPMQPAAVFQHPQVAQYGYAPLSPGKTGYLY